MVCVLGADRNSRYRGPPSYIGEPLISRLPEALATRGSRVTLKEDPLRLPGLSILAVDLNGVNWVRVGGFSPSGTVRVPSFRGSGGAACSRPPSRGGSVS